MVKRGDESPVGVGGHVWVFDINRCVYECGEDGHAIGGPIYREHWVKHEITGETSRSWVIGRLGRKVPKCGGRGIAFSEREVDDAVWVHDNKYKISRLVERCTDAAKLREVAKVMGYEGQARGGAA